MAAAEMSSEWLVDSCIRSRIATLEEAPLSPQADLPFIVADSTNVLRQHRRWMRFLPQIRPFYGEGTPLVPAQEGVLLTRTPSREM
jgi:hypothetical protein